MRGAALGSSHFLFLFFHCRFVIGPAVFFRIASILFLLLAAGFVVPANAHDPSAWGGLFRSRDLGANWFPCDAGLFIGGALGVAVHPQDPAQLLYGTDARLLRSKNGGRDWLTEAAATMPGAVFSVAFDEDGKGGLASSGTRIFYTNDGLTWQDALAPGGAAPARAFVRSSHASNRVYLAGARGLFASDDRGRSWARVADGVLPESAVSALIVTPGTTDSIYAVIDGNIWMSNDGARNWQMRAAGLPPGRVDTVGADLKKAGRLWSAVAAQVFVSDDAGMKWTAYGNPLPDSSTMVRGLVASDDAKTLVLSTHRGVMRSTDGGHSWAQVESTLPVHLESGLLFRDPHDAATLYAGFSLTPYGEMWRRAEQGGSLLAQLDPVSLAGGLAFLVFLVVACVLATRWLLRRYRDADAAPRFR
jgi:photosystem II stability/assembly factor-like uncharacterized protein